MKRANMRFRRVHAALLAVVALMVVGYGVSTARGEEVAKVLTVEKLAGPEAVVGDTVAAPLETGAKVEFAKNDGEISCAKSEIKGKIKANPEKGTGRAEIDVETFTFNECTTNVAGLTVKKVAIETLPLLAETVGMTASK